MIDVKYREDKEEWYNIPTELEKQFGLWIDCAGCTRAKPNYHVPARAISNYVLHMILEGHVLFRQNNQMYHLGQGDLFCLFPDLIAEYGIRTPARPLRMLYLAISGWNALPLLERAGLHSGTPHLHFREDAASLPAVQSIFRTLKQMPACKDLKLISAVSDFFSQLTASGDSAGEHGNWVRASKQYMDRHFMKGITVDHVADCLSVHRSYLTRRFSEVYRVTPKQYLLQLRMERATELLRQTTMPISDIADSLHYADVFSFSRAYKNYHRRSPSDTRRPSTK